MILEHTSERKRVHHPKDLCVVGNKEGNGTFNCPKNWVEKTI